MIQFIKPVTFSKIFVFISDNIVNRFLEKLKILSIKVVKVFYKNLPSAAFIIIKLRETRVRRTYFCDE